MFLVNTIEVHKQFFLNGDYILTFLGQFESVES